MNLSSKNISIIVIVLFILAAIWSSVFTVDQSSRGIILRNGAITEVAQPGMGLKIPFITSVKEISIQQQSAVYKSQPAYSYDQQPATMDVSVSFHVLPGQVENLYQKYGSLDGLVTRDISRQVPTQLENTFGRYTAVSVVQDRSKFVADLTIAINKSLANAPVVIDSVQVENINFSEAYENSIEQRMAAEINVEKKQQELKTAEVQAKIQVTNAQANADSQLAESTAKAKSVEMLGDAEAKAMQAKSDALKANPQLIQYEAATRWNGELPKTMIPGASVPMVSITK